MSRVLIVEDEDAVSRNLARQFVEFGFTVERAKDGDAAIRHLSSSGFDGVVLDLKLGGGVRPQGLAILEWIRKEQPLVAVVVVSAQPHLCERALEVGVDALLYKPIEALHVFRYLDRAMELRRLRAENAQLRALSTSAVETRISAFGAPNKRRVFIVYGRNSDAHSAMVLFLRALKLDPLDFDEVRADLGGAPFIGTIVSRGMQEAQAVIVLLTPDERASLCPNFVIAGDHGQDLDRLQPRPNVLLEAGMALGINERRTILVTIGNVSLPSDLHGRYAVALDNSVISRDKLKSALQGTGCEVGKLNPGYGDPGMAGDFEACIRDEEDRKSRRATI
jgi:CheY-like chemotaxis protein/predicted nucleotide-binding protein